MNVLQVAMVPSGSQSLLFQVEEGITTKKKKSVIFKVMYVHGFLKRKRPAL